MRARLRPPERDQLLQLDRVLGREVVALARIGRRVEQLPALLVEVSPRFRCGRHRGRGLPPLVPDRPRAEHRVELRLLRRGVRIVEAGFEADALDRLLRVAVDDVRELDAEALEQGRHDVDRVAVLAADLAIGLDPGRPRDDQRVGRAALVVRVALPQLEGRVERPRPAGRVVVVRPRAAELVEVLEVLLHRVRQPVEELVLVDGAVRPALARGAVVGDEHDDRVVELAAVSR